MGRIQLSNKPSIDRLSALPDDIICHILSFLLTKDSVATSTLARRWRFLWAYVPILVLDSRYYRYRPTPSFPDIVNRVLLLHKLQSVKTFCIRGDDLECSNDDLETWIATVISRNVQKVDIYRKGDVAFMLPQCLSTCRTLVDLSLSHFVFPTFNGSIRLPLLKKLKLWSVKFVIEENLPNLLSGCPVLEELAIDFVMDRDTTLHISSPTIKRLSCERDNYCEVKIIAPALRYLLLSDCSYGRTSLSQTITSLSEADIDMYTHTMVEDGTVKECSPCCVLKFLDSLCNVKRLKITDYQNLGLPQPGSVVKFDNLTKLELEASWCFLSYFLENADNLQDLIIHEVDSNQRCWMEPHQVPICLLSHLRTVEIDLEVGREQEFELIRYLLWNAKVLERMNVLSYRDRGTLKTKSDAIKRISSFKRGSEECELEIDEDIIPLEFTSIDESRILGIDDLEVIIIDEDC